METTNQSTPKSERPGVTPQLLMENLIFVTELDQMDYVESVLVKCAECVHVTAPESHSQSPCSLAS